MGEVATIIISLTVIFGLGATVFGVLIYFHKQTPEWQINKNERLKASVRRTSNEMKLKKIALEAKDWSVQEAAVSKITDQLFLKETALNKSLNLAVRFAALKNITDEEFLKKDVFLKSQYLRSATVRNTTDETSGSFTTGNCCKCGKETKHKIAYYTADVLSSKTEAVSDGDLTTTQYGNIEGHKGYFCSECANRYDHRTWKGLIVMGFLFAMTPLILYIIYGGNTNDIVDLLVSVVALGGLPIFIGFFMKKKREKRIKKDEIPKDDECASKMVSIICKDAKKANDDKKILIHELLAPALQVHSFESYSRVIVFMTTRMYEAIQRQNMFMPAGVFEEIVRQAKLDASGESSVDNEVNDSTKTSS